MTPQGDGGCAPWGHHVTRAKSEGCTFDRDRSRLLDNQKDNMRQVRYTSATFALALAAFAGNVTGYVVPIAPSEAKAA